MIKSLSTGCVLCAKSVGVAANFLIPAATLFSLASLHFFILSIIIGHFFKSSGSAPTSHKHHLLFPLIYSDAPKRGWIYFFAFGSFLINSFKSSSSIIKFPPSAGLLPYIILGISHKGLFRLRTNILSPSIR